MSILVHPSFTGLKHSLSTPSTTASFMLHSLRAGRFLFLNPLERPWETIPGRVHYACHFW
jgi:hypothetical protein